MILARSISLAVAAVSFTLTTGCAPSSERSVPAEEQGTVSHAESSTPSGAHYNLNIIGVPRDKSPNMGEGSGHRIFVPLYGRAEIALAPGDYGVVDANGTDGYAAFTLPNPDPENDGITEYSVYARALGTPGGGSSMTTCATDTETDEEYCSIYSAVFVREKGRSDWSNVSRELLYVYADLDGDGVVERYPLFDDALENYYWAYDNNGLKVVQLRFYEHPTDVNE